MIGDYNDFPNRGHWLKWMFWIGWTMLMCVWPALCGAATASPGWWLFLVPAYTGGVLMVDSVKWWLDGKWWINHD